MKHRVVAYILDDPDRPKLLLVLHPLHMAKQTRKIISKAKPAATTDRYYSRAIGNALRVLKLLQQSNTSLSLAEISRQVKLPKSSAFRIVRTLEIDGCLQRLEGERFAIMPSANFLPNHLVTKVVHASQEWMRHLSQEFRETISLACLFGNHIEVVAVIDSPHRVAMGNVVGDLIPPHASSLGKCIAAFQPHAQREKLLRSFSLIRFTPATIVEEVTLNKELDLVRAQGYATDLEESAMGGCCLSAPIFGNDSQVVAAISISMPKMRFTNHDRLITAAKDAAKAISEELRNTPN
jgi:IclR family acetate operon transcriptional repressor